MLPAELTPRLDTYFGRLPTGAARGVVSDAIWISRRGTPLAAGCLYQRITRTTRRRLGQPVNPHRFRHALATSIALDCPSEVRMATLLLGHRLLSTTDRYYNMAQTVEASRRYGRLLVELRAAGRQAARADQRDPQLCAPSFTPATPPTCSRPPRSRTRCGCCRELIGEQGWALDGVYEDQGDQRRLEPRPATSTSCGRRRRASSTWSSPKRSTGFRAIRRTLPRSTSASLRRHPPGHRGRGRDHAICMSASRAR